VLDAVYFAQPTLQCQSSEAGKCVKINIIRSQYIIIVILSILLMLISKPDSFQHTAIVIWRPTGKCLSWTCK